MNQPTQAQWPHIADLAAELGRIESEIATASHLVDTRQLPEVSGLLPRIFAVCRALAELPRTEAQAYLQTVRRLLAALDALADKLGESHRTLCQQLPASEPRPDHA